MENTGFILDSHVFSGNLGVLRKKGENSWILPHMGQFGWNKVCWNNCLFSLIRPFMNSSVSHFLHLLCSVVIIRDRTEKRLIWPLLSERWQFSMRRQYTGGQINERNNYEIIVSTIWKKVTWSWFKNFSIYWLSLSCLLYEWDIQSSSKLFWFLFWIVPVNLYEFFRGEKNALKIALLDHSLEDLFRLESFTLTFLKSLYLGMFILIKVLFI